ncbi:MAG TPA: hypothetical protein PKH39_05065 [Woeseiaceae bacterium]|nr:hypothetical protein [Woeseiaceae bacterium]
MTDESSVKPSTAFYVIAGIFMTWNLIGFMLYYQQMSAPPEAFASFGPEKAAFIVNTPVWANAAYALAVTFGVIASVLLLLRKSWAKPAYLLSFVAVLVQDFESFVLRDAVAVFGNVALIAPLLVLIVAIIEIWYSSSVANRYYR